MPLFSHGRGLRCFGLVLSAALLANVCSSTLADDKPDASYSSVEEAYAVGVAFYNSRNYKAAREPFEAALKLAKDDDAMRLRIYDALLQPYRLIPEFEPFQNAAEYIIANHPQSASRSLTRRSFLSFAYQRGQMEGLVKRYEDRLAKDTNDYLSLYLLSEIYSAGAGLAPSVENSKRAIELIKRLEQVEAGRSSSDGRDPTKMTADAAAKIAREKGQLARQYMKAKEYKEAVRLYEEIAPLDPTTHAWNLKEAASGWMKLKNEEEALRLALAAENAPAEARNEQLTHFFERNLGDIFMQLNKPEKAIPHYRIAMTKTTIDGYIQGTKASLDQALELVK